MALSISLRSKKKQAKRRCGFWACAQVSIGSAFCEKKWRIWDMKMLSWCVCLRKNTTSLFMIVKLFFFLNLQSFTQASPFMREILLSSKWNVFSFLCGASLEQCGSSEPAWFAQMSEKHSEILEIQQLTPLYSIFL